MKLYLDDDLDSNVLISLLKQLGHEVTSPRDVGTRGAPDGDHLQYAADNGLVLMSANAGDFVQLNRKWVERRTGHSGILIVYRENNPVRDMSFRDITEAIGIVEESRIPIANTCQNLNFWRRP